MSITITYVVNSGWQIRTTRSIQITMNVNRSVVPHIENSNTMIQCLHLFISTTTIFRFENYILQNIIQTLNRSCSSSSSSYSYYYYSYYYITNFASNCDWLVDVMSLHSKHTIGPYNHTLVYTEKVWVILHVHKNAYFSATSWARPFI